MTNEKLGRLFNMSYSAISHCVKTFKEKMNKDKKVKKRFTLPFNILLSETFYFLIL